MKCACRAVSNLIYSWYSLFSLPYFFFINISFMNIYIFIQRGEIHRMLKRKIYALNFQPIEIRKLPNYDG